MQELSPSKTESFVIAALQRGKIPYIAGPPGIGKSEIVSQIADKFGMKLVDIRLSQMQPEDLIGIPLIDHTTKRAYYCPFGLFPLEGDPLPVDSNGAPMNGWVIFLDELSSSSQEVLAAIYKLILDRKIGEFNLHPKALIVGAGNRETDSAIARKLPDTIITRMLPVTMKANTRDWLKWCKANGNSVVGNFIKKYPDSLLATGDPNAREELETYPTPRGWAAVCAVLNFVENNYPKKITNDAAGMPTNADNPPEPAEVDWHLINSAVGKAASTAIREYYKETTTLPTPWDIAQAPQAVTVPLTTSGKATVIEDLVGYFLTQPDAIRDNILMYINRMENEHRASFVSTVKGKLGTSPSEVKLVKTISDILHVNIGNTIDTSSNKDNIFSYMKFKFEWDRLDHVIQE